MTKILTNVLAHNHIPSCWKTAHLTPIPKKVERKNINNYRGIAMQTVFSKLLDKFITNKLYRYLQHFILDSQHGFIKGRSTISNLLEVVADLNSHINNGLSTDVIYFDITKAFKLNHKILFKKLAMAATPLTVMELIHYFISGRNYILTYNDQLYSQPVKATCGIPQGSHLGPLRFIVY